LTSLAAAGIAFLILVLIGFLEPVYVVYLLVGWMVFVRHRSNIINLIKGKERRLGDRV
jgi:glycerol-3-phosphate acyltransferase PlsY